MVLGRRGANRAPNLASTLRVGRHILNKKKTSSLSLIVEKQTQPIPFQQQTIKKSSTCREESNGKMIN